MDLTGQLALVTGSSRGLGAAIARRLSSHGASVIINYKSNRSTVDAMALSDTLPNSLVCQADVTDKSQVIAMFDKAERHFAMPVSIVINNALPSSYVFNGDARKKLDKISWEDFDHHQQGTLRAALNTTQAAIPHFERLRASSTSNGQTLSTSPFRIINIGSNLVSNPVVPYQDYTAAKGALLAFTRTCAKELGERGVTCNMISGGLLRTTEASKETPDGVFEGVVAATPLGRVTTPEEVADAVLFFASALSGGITGQNLNVDGGLVMG